MSSNLQDWTFNNPSRWNWTIIRSLNVGAIPWGFIKKKKKYSKHCREIIWGKKFGTQPTLENKRKI